MVRTTRIKSGVSRMKTGIYSDRAYTMESIDCVSFTVGMTNELNWYNTCDEYREWREVDWRDDYLYSHWIDSGWTPVDYVYSFDYGDDYIEV